MWRFDDYNAENSERKNLPSISCSSPMLCPIMWDMVLASFSGLDRIDLTDITDMARSVHIESGIDIPDDRPSNSLPLKHEDRWLCSFASRTLSPMINVVNAYSRHNKQNVCNIFKCWWKVNIDFKLKMQYDFYFAHWYAINFEVRENCERQQYLCLACSMKITLNLHQFNAWREFKYDQL